VIIKDASDAMDSDAEVDIENDSDDDDERKV
jgi:hypothetical protein